MGRRIDSNLGQSPHRGTVMRGYDSQHSTHLRLGRDRHPLVNYPNSGALIISMGPFSRGYRVLGSNLPTLYPNDGESI